MTYILFRRYSLASTGSGVSSTSSLSDIWAGAGPGGGASVWGGDHNDVTLGLYSGAGPGDLLRRRGSDSDCFSARTLRETELGAWHREAARRRSSGYVSDASPAPAPTPVPGPAPSPGMEHVPQWLKHLRLHKYTECIMRLTYQDLVSLTDEQLQGMSVTKGARRKFLLSIQKLGERPQALAEMGARLETENCDMKEILGDLETIVRSPILIEDTFVPDQPGPRGNNDSAADSGAEVSEDEDDQGKRMKAKVDEEASATPSVVPGQQVTTCICEKVST